MNELKLSLQNFQSISEGELVFKTGLNFIIGQSNSGKSATFRALKACLLNPAGSQRFIKRGTSKAIVTLTYNGNEISWNKSEKANSYSINGEDYRNTGKSDAFKILDENTGFVRAEKGSTLMNVEEELQLPFPFGISDSDLFKLFENVFCVSDSAVILKSAKEHEDKVKDEIKLLEIEEAKLKVKLESLEQFKKEINLKEIEEHKQALCDKAEKLRELNDGLEVIKIACKLESNNVKAKEKEFKNLLILHNNLMECKEVLSVSKRLHTLNKQLKSINLTIDSKLIDLNELNELSKTVNILKKLHSIKLKETNFENRLNALRDLKTTRSYIDKIKSEIQELKANKKREEEKVISIEAKLKEYKICPLCHHSLED